MAAREEAQENRHSGHRLLDNGVDVLPHHGYKDDRVKDMGSV